MSDSISHTTQGVNTQEVKKDTQTAIGNAANMVADKSAAAYGAVANHPITQNITNGPVAENVKAEAAKTSSEFSNLSASRTTPTSPAATGQQLTHYHSFFTTLLSWENPRASGIAYVAVVLFIFGARYLDLLRYAFKLTWMTLGVTAAAEIAGKTLFNNGFASQFRPNKYYVLPKQTLDSVVGDVHELINFFVIESQRIVFAENVYATTAAFLGAFFSYYLMKLVPFWGLSLISVSVLFLAPLIYKTNKEFIDTNLRNASEVVNQQTEQVKTLATQHATAAANTTKQYVSEYSAKAQDLINSRSTSPTVTKSPASFSDAKPKPVAPTAATTEINFDSKVLGSSNASTLNSGPKISDFPAAPKEPFFSADATKNEFVTAPSVGDTARGLKLDEDPLVAL